MHKPTIFVLSYERPIYLWAALDSLYRGTFTPVRVILVDSGSRDPLVHRVIDSFDRRGLFERVLRLPENDWDWVEPFFERELAGVGDVFFYMESDVVIAPAADCWVGRMLRVMERDPRLAMLGSRIDKSDFIDPAAVEARWRRPLTAGELAQLKLHSPERKLPDMGDDDVISPFNPPGRLLALRTDAVRTHLKSVDDWRDDAMHHAFVANGWRTGIYGGVVHRHLSLCNFWDYGDYSVEQRDAYMTGSKRT